MFSIPPLPYHPSTTSTLRSTSSRPTGSRARPPTPAPPGSHPMRPTPASTRPTRSPAPARTAAPPASRFIQSKHSNRDRRMTYLQLFRVNAHTSIRFADSTSVECLFSIPPLPGSRPGRRTRTPAPRSTRTRAGTRWRGPLRCRVSGLGFRVSNQSVFSRRWKPVLSGFRRREKTAAAQVELNRGRSGVPVGPCHRAPLSGFW